MNALRFSLLVFFVMIVEFSCDETLNRPLSPPTPLYITSIYPLFSSQVHQDFLVHTPVIITITGSGFSNQISGNIVAFGSAGKGTKGTVLSATSTQLTVEVPYLFTYGQYEMYVTAFGFTVRSPQPFTLDS